MDSAELQEKIEQVIGQAMLDTIYLAKPQSTEDDRKMAEQILERIPAIIQSRIRQRKSDYPLLKLGMLWDLPKEVEFEPTLEDLVGRAKVVNKTCLEAGLETSIRYIHSADEPNHWHSGYYLIIDWSNSNASISI